MPLRPTHWLLAALLLVPGCATTGAIRGTLRLPPAAVAGVIASPASGRATTAARPQEAVIYLEAVVTAKVKKRSAPRVERIGQLEHRFEPRVLPIAVGTTVEFENRDRVYQNVFSVSPAKRFDTGKVPPRQVRRVTFDKAGVVSTFSDIDPAMAGFVFVLPHAAFAQPDASGAFELPRLPRGRYLLKAWHPTLGRISRKVEIPKKGDLAVTLSY